jgi:hypothetical protein
MMTLFPAPEDIRGDDADIANALAQQEIDRALANRRTEPELEITGFCHNCDEELWPAYSAHEPRFCDADCRDDYMRREWAEGQRDG